MAKQQASSAAPLAILGIAGFLFALLCVVVRDEPKLEPQPAVEVKTKPAPKVVKPTYVPPVLPTPEPPPRDIATEPTAALLAEWNTWRHSPAPHNKEIQRVYEELLRRDVIRRDGEPAEGDYGGRRKIGRRR